MDAQGSPYVDDFALASSRSHVRLVKSCMQVENDIKQKMRQAFGDCFGDPACKRVLSRFCRGPMGFSSIFSASMGDVSFPMHRTNVPECSTAIHGIGWDMAVGGIKVVCDVPLIFRKGDEKGVDVYADSNNPDRFLQHSNRLWMQVCMPWSRLKTGTMMAQPALGKGYITKVQHDLMCLNERAYWTVLSTVFDCLNEDDTHFYGVNEHGRFDPDPFASNLVALRPFDYVFFREATFGFSDREEYEGSAMDRVQKQEGARGTSASFVALHDNHLVLAFVHRVTRYDPLTSSMYPLKVTRGYTQVTMDIRKISFECCIPPSFPLREIIENYHRGNLELLEERCTEERVAEWRCIVMPATMLDARSKGIANIESAVSSLVTSELLSQTVLVSRNVSCLAEFHACMDIEGIRTLLKFQVDMMLARNENIDTYSINPFQDPIDRDVRLRSIVPNWQAPQRRRANARSRKFIDEVTQFTGMLAFLPDSPQQLP
jgi:hypothetical protein